MAGPQHLKLLVGKRLAAAAEEIFGLVEGTIAEYQDEVVRSKEEIIRLKRELKQLTVLKPTVILHQADAQRPSLQGRDTEVRHTPKLKETETHDHTQSVKEETVDPSVIPELDVSSFRSVTVGHFQEESIADPQLLPNSVPVTLGETTKVEEWNGSNNSSALGLSDSNAAWMEVEPLKDEKPYSVFDSQSVCEEPVPSLQQCDSKVEQIYSGEETETQDRPQVPENKWTPAFSWDSFFYDDTLQQCDINVVQIPSQEEMGTIKLTQVKEEQPGLISDFESGICSTVEMRRCISTSSTDCDLSSAAVESVNVDIDVKSQENNGSLSPRQSHSIDVFLGLEKPERDGRSCHICGKMFKKDCYLFKHVAVKHEDHKPLKCCVCNKEFNQRYHLNLHTRIHTGEKPFSCEFCGKTFAQNSTHIVHMRQHTGEKPYFCQRCGRRFTNSAHLARCTELPHKSKEKKFRCSSCGKGFDSVSNLKVHMEIHASWKRHIARKLWEPSQEENM